LRIGTAITEGTANFLVNHRMNKSQQTRWSRRGADLLLRVRCAVYIGPRSIMVRLVPNSDRSSIQPTTHSRQPLLPPDPQFCTGPRITSPRLYRGRAGQQRSGLGPGTRPRFAAFALTLAQIRH
jgi:hypothetical protein